jgi:formylglycine-generating enzyme required for sulfatase activity
MPEEKLIMLPPNVENTSHKSGKNYLLVIGIDKYADANVPTLKNAVRDTERLTKILTDKYGFHLFRELHDEKATRLAILDAIEELEKRLKMEDNLVVFFSGHGYRKSKSGYIVPFDGRNDRTTDYISFADLNARIDELPMHHFLFILDCCFAGSALKNLGEKRELNKPSRRVLAASSPDETAEDGFYGRNSPFTSALAEILEGNEGTELPVKTLHVQLRDLMDIKGVRQVPIEGSWKMDSNRDGEFIFLKKDVELDTWNALDKTDKIALKAFVIKYPNGVFSAEAMALIEEIEEIEAKEAEKRQKDEANRKIEAEKQAFERAKKSGTKESLSNFIFDYPLSIYRSEARKLLEIAEEAAAWKEAKRKNLLSAFLDFQEIYGSGQYGDECQKRIDSFRKPAPPPGVELPKPPVVVVTPKIETLALIEQPKPTIVENPKEKEVQYIENKKIKKVVVPLFLHNITLFLLAGSLISGFYLFWVMFPHAKSNINNESKQTNSSKIEPTKSVLDIKDTLPTAGFKVVLSTSSVSTPLIEPKMVKVEGGTFQMGSNAEDDEKPIHPVKLSTFYIGKYEVTQVEWRAVMGKNPKYLTKFKGDNMPVHSVSWNDIQDFLKKLNACGKKYRLPTEAEWEFAARGGTNTKGYTYSGSNDIKSVAWLYENSGNKAHAVGGRNANELGVYDMSGNVLEWCQDWYKGYPGSSGVIDLTSSDRVIRGGNWGGYDGFCRLACRSYYSLTYRNDNLGFRLATSSL